jgi:hypothetical protein
MLYGMLSFLPRRDSLLARSTATPHRHGDRGRPDPCPEQADLLLLARGLQRLMAQCRGAVADRHFPAALKAHRALRVQQGLGVALRLPAELLSDLCHEIAEYVEAPVREAAVRCLRSHASRRAAAGRS